MNSVMRKIKDATLTIEGPVGVSKAYEAFKPSTADETPIKQAKKAIFSGVDPSDRADAAGMINIEMISNTPTTFMPTATTTASAIVSTKLSLFGFKPLAAAKSSLRVHNNSADHRQINRSNTRTNPAHIKKMSVFDTAKISPIR